MSDPGFWQSHERYATIDEAERTDRIDTSAKTARSLLKRLNHGARQQPALNLIRNLAEQLFVLEVAADNGFDCMR
jgi:hypothetical protein